MCLLPPKLFSAKKKQPFRQSRGSFVQYTNLKKWLPWNYEWVFLIKKKSSFQEAIKRKFSLTNLNQLRKVYFKKKKQTNKTKQNTQQERKRDLAHLQSIIHYQIKFYQSK